MARFSLKCQGVALVTLLIALGVGSAWALWAAMAAFGVGVLALVASALR